MYPCYPVQFGPLTLLDGSLLLLVGQLLLEISLVGIGELGEIEGGIHFSE